jgi:hypothetical protein
MKNNSTLFPVLLAGLLLPFLFSCKKDAVKAVPTVTLGTLTTITTTTVTIGGKITSDGGVALTDLGACWGVNQNPAISDNKVTGSISAGSITGFIAGLTPGVTYYVRLYAANPVGIGYSSQTSFKTLTSAPLVSTSELSAITSTSATSGGNISCDGGAAVTARGVCWSTSQNPSISNSKTSDGTGDGSFTSNITGIDSHTVFFIRAYATNSIGTGYGNEVYLNLIPPSLTTTLSKGTYGGIVSTDGGCQITARGICWSYNVYPTIADNKSTDGSGLGSFTSIITPAPQQGAYFYFRAYATNCYGTFYGNQMTGYTPVPSIGPGTF